MERFSSERRFARTILVFGLILGSIAACGKSDQATPTPIPPTPTVEAFESPLLPTPTMPPLTPEAGSGGVLGAIVSYPPAWAGLRLSVYLSPFYSTGKEDEGFFILEPSEHPGAQVLAGGLFYVENVPPAQYVIVIGPTPDEALAVQSGDRPQIFEVLEGEILDVGEIRVGEQ